MTHLPDQILQQLADGALAPEAAREAQAHCEGCASCGAQLREYRELFGGLEALPVPPPPMRFTAQVMARVEAREAQLARQRLLALGTLLGSSALAAVCFALAGGAAWARQLSAFTSRTLQLTHLAQVVLGAAEPVLLAWRLPLLIAVAAVCIPTLLALHRSVAPRPQAA